MSHNADLLIDESAPAPRKPRMVRTAVVVGTALEHYDFFLYGTAAALVFNHQYFTSDNPLVASLAAFATFAVGFVARPLGAVVFGHLGDTIGRRKTLILTLVLMGLATGFIGVIPNYAAIGVWAPIALITLRLLQGLSFGGEWAGAVTLATEHAPRGKQGLYATLPQLGSPIGNIVGSGAFLLLGLLPPETFDSWGWRVPFLLAFPLVGVALWIRALVDESPAFKTATKTNQIQKAPAWEVVRRTPGRVLIAAAVSFMNIGGFFVATTFAISYGTGTVGLSRETMLTATLTAALVQIIVTVITGLVADRFDPLRLATVSFIVAVVLAFPWVWLLSSGSAVAAVIATILVIMPMAVSYGVTGAILPKLFPPTLRYSGVAIGFNIAGFVGGFMPMLATSLMIAFDSQAWPLAALFTVIALISMGGALAARQVLRNQQRNSQE